MANKPPQSKLAHLKNKAKTPSPPTRRGLSRRFLLASGLGLVGVGVAGGIWWVFNQPPDDTNIPRYRYEIVNRFPHNPEAFTQGLEYFQDDILYEGTGLEGQSELRKVNLRTGDVLQSHPLGQDPFGRDYFGEGITIWNDTIIQLTWRNQIGFVYERESFRQIDQFAYDYEGWGLTHDDRHLIVSDGTPTLRFLDPTSKEEVRSLNVSQNGRYISLLNELEYIDGEIYANIWGEDRIVRISPETGHVVGILDLTGLRDEAEIETNEPREAVLNGIAYDRDGDRLLVTGKLWGRLFEIRQVPGNG